jgi:hypothetical protein
VAVDQQGALGLELADRLRRQQPAVGHRDRLAVAAVAGSLGGLGDGLVADQLRGKLERGRVGLAGQDELGAVAVEHGGGTAAVPVGELGLVVPDRQELDALAAAGGGQLGQLLDGRTVAGLVQADEQPWVEHAVGLLGGQLLRPADDDGDQQLKQRPQAFLLRGRGVQVQRVVRPGEQRVQVEVAALGRLRDGGVAEDVQEGLGGAEHAAAGVVGPGDAGGPGVQGLLVAELAQAGGDLVEVLHVDPAGDLGHGAVRARRGIEDAGQELGAQQLPVGGVVLLWPWTSAASASMRPTRLALAYVWQ